MNSPNNYNSAEDQFKRQIEEIDSKSKSLQEAVQRLRESGTDEEYQGLIKDMFNKLNRAQQRKLVGKKNRFSHNVSQAIFKKK